MPVGGGPLWVELGQRPRAPDGRALEAGSFADTGAHDSELAAVLPDDRQAAVRVEQGLRRFGQRRERAVDGRRLVDRHRRIHETGSVHVGGVARRHAVLRPARSGG